MPFLSADRLNGLRGVAPIDQLQTDAESARKDLQRTLRAVSQRREAIIQGADAIMKISNDAAKEFDKTVLTAMLKFQDMHRLLEMREAALIDAARASMLAKVTNLQSQYNSLQHAVETIDKEATHAKQLLEEGDPSEIASLGHHFVDRISNLAELRVRTECSEEFDISCDIDVTPLQNSLKRIGEIRLVPLPPAPAPPPSQPDQTTQNATASKSVKELLSSPSPSFSNASPRPSLNGKGLHKSPQPSPSVQPMLTSPLGLKKTKMIHEYHHVHKGGNTSIVAFTASLRQPPPPSPLRPSSRGSSPAPFSQFSGNSKSGTPRADGQSGSASQKGNSPAGSTSPRVQKQPGFAALELGSPRDTSIMRLTASSLCKRSVPRTPPPPPDQTDA